MTTIQEDIPSAWEATPLYNTTEQMQSQSSIDLVCSEEIKALPQDAGGSLPLSYSQSMFWSLYAFQGNPTCLNHTVLFQLNGTLRTEDLDNAISQLGKRHECLRTRFFVENGRPRKSVLAISRISLERYDIREESEAHEFAEALQEHTFDWEQGGTLRVALLSLSSANHLLALVTHSLVMDEFSGADLVRELMQLYDRQSLSDGVLQCSGYGEKQRATHAAGGFSTELMFWRDIYKDFPPPLPILHVSPLSTRPPSLTFENNRFDIRIDASLKSSVNAACRRYRVTNFHFYLATLRALLWRYTKEEEIAIGIGDAKGTGDGCVGSIGPYVNILPLRFHNLGSLYFGEMLQETRSTVYSALANSRVPFQLLLDELVILLHRHC